MAIRYVLAEEADCLVLQNFVHDEVNIGICSKFVTHLVN